MRRRILLLGICLAVFSVPSLAQTSERRPRDPGSQPEEQSSTAALSPGVVDSVANEIGKLRTSLEAISVRLREISERLLVSGTERNDVSKGQQNRIALSLDLLSRAELRAEVLRKQLFELIEKETNLRSRLLQIEEEIRPESLERAMSLAGSTRTPEQREVRRRVLDNERKGYESLLNQASQSRSRLEEDVKQADAIVSKLRQRVFPLIEKEIESITPNQ
jgi:DNA primase